MRILLAEDDAMIGEVVLDARRAEHYAADWVRDGAMAQTALATAPYDLLLLDLGLPRQDGLAVLRNLLDNALRHTPEGGRVRVSIEPAPTEPAGEPVPARPGEPAPAGQGALLAVEDSGPGIAPEDRARVLDCFYRAPGAPGHGSGLGLAIARAVAERHGAVIEAGASAALGGARLVLRFSGASD